VLVSGTRAGAVCRTHSFDRGPPEPRVRLQGCCKRPHVRLRWTSRLRTTLESRLHRLKQACARWKSAWRAKRADPPRRRSVFPRKLIFPRKRARRQPWGQAEHRITLQTTSPGQTWTRRNGYVMSARPHPQHLRPHTPTRCTEALGTSTSKQPLEKAFPELYSANQTD
jgi:hypothetical protein